MKRFYTLSGMRTGNRPYRPGGIVIEAFTVCNRLQGLFDGNIPQGHRECAFYTVIDDKIHLVPTVPVLRERSEQGHPSPEYRWQLPERAGNNRQLPPRLWYKAS